MKKYTVLFLILFFSLSLFGCSKKKVELTDLEKIKQRGYLIVGVKTDSAPFGYYDKNKKLIGLDVALAKGIADNIFENDSPANIKYVSVNPQNRISKLNSQEIDLLVATMSINNKRKLILDFSKPYFVTSQKLMVRKTSNITNLNYLNKDGKLAIVLGTTGEKVAKMVAPNANLVGVKTYTEAKKILLNKQVDAFLGDDCIMTGFNNEELKIINHSYSKEYYAVALRKTEESKSLMNVVNMTISEFLDNKKLNLVKKTLK